MSSERNNVRKKLFSKNKKNTINKKVATGDANEEVSNENNISGKTKKIEMEIKENKELDQEERLLELQKSNIKLEEELKTLEVQYESEKIDNIDKLKTINNELLEKSNQSKIISKENHKLITKLKTLENGLNEKYTKIMNKELFKKRTSNKKTEKQIQKDIKVREKQIDIIKKISERAKVEKEKYENMLNDAENMESEKMKELDHLNELIEEAKVEHEDLDRMRLEHINCYNEIQNLLSTVNLLHNEIEFEKKKYTMMSNVNKDNKIKKEPNEELNLLQKKSLLSPKLIYSKKIRDLAITKNIPKVEKVNKSTIRYIQTEFELMNKMKTVNNYINKKNILEGNNGPTSVLDDIYVPPANLFTERETEVLSTIIPKSNLSEYMGKFTERKKEVDEIQELFSEKDEIKNKNVEKKFEIDNIKINIKVADRIKTDLMNKFRKNKRKIFNIKKEISETENKIKEKEVILNRLNKINKNYNYIFQKAQKRK